VRTTLLAAVIFDLDGTLADSLRDIAEHMNATLVAAGLPPRPISDYTPLVGEGVRALVRRAVPDGDVDALVAAFRARYRAAPVRHTRAYPGIDAMLDELAARGLRLGVLSNKPHDLTVAVVAALFDARFSAVFGEREGVAKKPDPAAAVAVARALEVEPSRCALVGDSATDIATARAAGMRAIGVSWGLRPRQELVEAGADAVIDAPVELARWLA
jgi:phosphoglycolate phosphatase